MRSIPACYRCLLLLLLPLVIVFSVVYYTNPLLSTTGNYSLSSQILSTEKSTKPNNCTPFIIPDTRPFFEREPPQYNLPRSVLNLSRENLRYRLQSLRLATVACGRNVEQNFDKFRKYAEEITDLFHPSSRIIIVESDSSDNTLAKLRQWSRAEVHTLGDLSKTIPIRTNRLAICRNMLLDRARQLEADYMFVADMDLFGANVSSFLTNFDYDTNDWSVMTANLMKEYYDIWALRTLSDSILNFDVWHLVWSVPAAGNYCYDSVLKNAVSNHQKSLPAERALLEVRSAFGGAGLYKMAATRSCSYVGEPVTCEHVPFHICMREQNQARIFINPRFTNQ